MPLETIKKIKQAELDTETAIKEARKEASERIGAAHRKADEILLKSKQEAEQKIEKLAKENLTRIRQEKETIVQDSSKKIKDLSLTVSSRLEKAKELLKGRLLEGEY